MTTGPTANRAPGASRRIPTAFRAFAAGGLALVAVCAGALIGVLPAQAAGNSSLDHLIVTNPEPGWTSLSSSELDTFQSDVQNELTGKGSTQTFATAVEGWQSPQGFSTSSLVIFLVQALTGSVGGTASDEASGFCNGATGQTPTSPQPISGVSDGATTTCSGEGENVTVGSGITGNYLTLVASFGSSPLPASTIGPIVSNQVAAVNNSQSTGSGSTTPSGSTSSSSSLPIIAGAGGGAVVVIAVIVFFLLRRRNSGQLAGATPGQGSAPAYMQGPPGQTGFDPSSPPPAPAPGSLGGSFAGGLPPSPPTAAATPPSAGAPAPYPSAPYQAVPSAPQSHDPWGDSDPGWLSSHEAAEAGAAQVATAPGAASGAAPRAAGQSDPEGARAPGWYPEGDDPSTMRYWDGSTFTSRRRWDGSNWIDA